MRVQGHWGWVIALGWLTTAVAAPEKGNVYLVQAKVFYQGMEFEKCLQRLEQADRVSDLTRQVMADIELYGGLCKFNLGKRDDAESHFRRALQLNPDVTLPPATSPRIAEVFEPVAEQIRRARTDADAVAARQPQVASSNVERAEAEAQDSPRELTLAPTAKSDARADLVATVPAQGGSKVLPIALGGTSVAAATVATVFAVMANNHAAQANAPATYYADSVALGNDARREMLIGNVLFGVAGTAAVGAVITWFTAQ
jgi:tetratricopeptide (TPR) repeat protein